MALWKEPSNTRKHKRKPIAFSGLWRHQQTQPTVQLSEIAAREAVEKISGLSWLVPPLAASLEAKRSITSLPVTPLLLFRSLYSKVQIWTCDADVLLWQKHFKHLIEEACTRGHFDGVCWQKNRPPHITTTVFVQHGDIKDVVKQSDLSIGLKHSSMKSGGWPGKAVLSFFFNLGLVKAWMFWGKAYILETSMVIFLGENSLLTMRSLDPIEARDKYRYKGEGNL